MKRRFKLIDETAEKPLLTENKVSPGDFFACYHNHDYDKLQFFVKRSKEFNMNTVLPGNEPTPSNPGEFYSYQRLFASLMFYYPRMLLLSEPGTGKSISFIEAVENSKRSGIIKRVIWLENSPNIHNDISRQIISKAVKPDIYNYPLLKGSNITRNEKRAERRGILKELSSFYEVITYEGLESKYKVSEMSDQQVIDEFSGVFIVADEAHHLTTQDGDPAKVFPTIDRIVNTAKGVRLLLVSATIMTNSSLQIIPISDLLLPPEKRLTVNERKFLETNKNSPTVSEIIFNRLKGYTSYISANTSVAQPVFITKSWVNGTVNETLENTIDSVYYSPMSDFQIAYYNKFSNQDSQTDKQDAALFKSRQASTFAFPDDTIGGRPGEEGTGLGIYAENWKPVDGVSLGRYKFKSDAFVGLNSKDDRDLSDLGRYSSKFKEIIDLERKSFGRFLKGSVKDAGTTMVYSEYKFGAGAVLLSLFFERYGFSDYRKGKNLENHKVPKFALLTPEAEDQIEAVREVFNSKENVDGSKIRILIVSKALRDGVNLSHAIRAHMLFPSWNEAAEKQAMYRVIRADSHNELSNYRKSNGVDEPIKIQIYKHGAFIPIVPGINIEKSSDYIIYKKLFEKDSQINLVLKGLKKGALDYFLTRQRNNQPWNNFEDYNEEERNSVDLVVTSHNYNSDFVIPVEIQSSFKDLIQAKTNNTLTELVSKRESYDSHIDKFILNLMEIRGLKCNKGYVNVSNKLGVPFITHRMGKSDYDDYYYKNNIIGNIKRNFMDSTFELFKQSDINTINTMIKDSSPNNIINYFSNLGSIYSINQYIETGIINLIENDKFNNLSFSIIYNRDTLNYSSYFRKGHSVKSIREEALKLPGITKDNVAKYVLPGFSDSATIIINSLLQNTNGIEVYGSYSDKNRFVNRKQLIRILVMEKSKQLKWRYVLEGPETEVFNNIKQEIAMVKKKKVIESADVIEDEEGTILGRLVVSDGTFSIIDRRQSSTNTGRVCKTYKKEELDEFILALIPSGVKPSEFIKSVRPTDKFTTAQLSQIDSIGLTSYFKNKDQKCSLIKDILKYNNLLKTI